MNAGVMQEQRATAAEVRPVVQEGLNPDIPVVVSASTDLGYASYLMSRSRVHSGWSTARIMDLLLPALSCRQIRVYCDGKGAPTGFVVWAFLDAEAEAELRAGRMPGDAAEFRSGDRLWILLFVAPFGGARDMLRELRSNVFQAGQEGRRIKYADDGSVCRLGKWRGGRRSDGPPRSAGAVLGDVWGETPRVGYFNGHAATLNEAITRGHDRLATLLAPKEGERVLDLGCGVGAAARRLARNHHCHVTGIDDKVWRVNRAFEMTGRQPNVTYRWAPLSELPEDSESFDLALATETLSKAHDLPGVLAECNRVLKPGGRLAISEVTGQPEDDTAEVREALGIETLLSAAQWPEALRKAGFEVVQTEDWGEHRRRTFEALKDSLLRNHAGRKDDLGAIRKLDAGAEAADAGLLGHTVLIVEKRRPPAVAALPQKKEPEKRSTLVMLSGGIDSVYALWKILTETDDEVIAHHINFVNQERRHVVEAQRCRGIVNHLRRTVRQFEYSESTLDHRSHRFFGYDMVAVGFEAGLVAHSHLFRNNRPIDRWTFGACVEEEIGLQGRWPHVVACCAANCFPHQAPEPFELPVVTKQQEVSSLPADLLALTWGCRRPVADESGYRPCGVCKTCKLLNSIAPRRQGRGATAT